MGKGVRRRIGEGVGGRIRGGAGGGIGKGGGAGGRGEREGKDIVHTLVAAVAVAVVNGQHIVAVEKIRGGYGDGSAGVPDYAGSAQRVSVDPAAEKFPGLISVVRLDRQHRCLLYTSPSPRD